MCDPAGGAHAPDAKHNRPFRDGKIACVEELFGRYSEAEFSPRNGAVHQIVANPRNHNLLKAPEFTPGRALTAAQNPPRRDG